MTSYRDCENKWSSYRQRMKDFPQHKMQVLGKVVCNQYNEDCRFYIPREQRCPKFSGPMGTSALSLEEWIEEIQSCMRSRELTRLVRADGCLSLLDVRREAIRWMEEDQPGHSGCQCAVLDSVEFLLEPLEFGDGQLPEGLLVSPALVSAKKGLLYALVVNVSKTDVCLPPCHVIGTVQLGTVTSMTTALSMSISPSWDDLGLAFVSVQEIIPTPRSPHGTVLSDIEGLTDKKMESVKALLEKYQDIFALGEGTFQHLLECMFGGQRYHSIPLYLDDVNVFSSNVQQQLERLGEVFS
ncbi:hypothetical protein SRHO_G00194360 [Serrasalmus rhombeus]